MDGVGMVMWVSKKMDQRSPLFAQEADPCSTEGEAGALLYILSANQQWDFVVVKLFSSQKPIFPLNTSQALSLLFI